MEQTKTYMARPDEIAPKWWLVDAADKVVGRLASDLAMLLMGKNRPTYTPHVNNGDYVIVINAEKVVLTGRKWEQKQYAWYTGHPGQHTETAARRRKRRPELHPPRGRSADAAEEQAGLQDARQAEDLQRQRAPAPGPGTGTHRTGDQGLETDMVVVKSNDILGTGRRKTSVARVRLRAGDGKIRINRRDLEVYFNNIRQRNAVLAPLEQTGKRAEFDVIISVDGGGITGQADACKLGIARALKKYDVQFGEAMRDTNLLTRDGRMKSARSTASAAPGAVLSFPSVNGLAALVFAAVVP